MSVKDKENFSIAVIGYGSQGRAFALNLRDSGYDVVIGLRQQSKSKKIARADNFKSILSIPNAVKKSDLIIMAFPDHLHQKIYEADIRTNLKKGQALLFLHGLSIHFGYVLPPADCDVLLLAPHAPGNAVREKYLSDRSISAFYAIRRQGSRKARARLFEVADAVGFEKKRLIKTTFADEAIGDIFGEQAVLCGGMVSLINSGYQVLIENGHHPEHAYLEVAYQLDLIIALIKKHGIKGMFDRISVTAQVGSAKAGNFLIDDSVKKRMNKLYREISDGGFTDFFRSLSDKNLKKELNKLNRLTSESLEKAAKKFSK